MRALLLCLLMLAPAAASAGSLQTLGPLYPDTGPYPGPRDTRPCTHRFTGSLENGDAALFEAIATDNENFAMLCLDSPGGSFGEAIRIAKLFSDKNIGTRIEAGATCESACALIFMAGRHVSNQTENITRLRILHPQGRLGFHAPALVIPEGAYQAETVNRAYNVALGTVSSAISEIIQSGTPDAGDNIRMSLLGTMLSTPSDSMHYITTTGEAGRWQIELGPLDMPFPKDNTSLVRGCLNAWSWQFDRAAGPETWEFPVRPTDEDPNAFDVTISEISGDSCRIYFSGAEYPAALTLSGRSGKGEVYFEAWGFTGPDTKIASLRGLPLDGKPVPVNLAPVPAPSPSPTSPAFEANGECTVGNAPAYKDKEPCRRSVEERTANGSKSLVMTYLWPSGAQTVIVRAPDGDTIDGAPTAVTAHVSTAAGECALNPKSGNLFCFATK